MTGSPRRSRAPARDVLLWVIGAYRGRQRRRAGGPAQRVRLPAGRPLPGRLGDPLQPQRAARSSASALVPLRRFELRGHARAGPQLPPGASLYAETVCATVPNYGAELTFTGICNPQRRARPRAERSSRPPTTGAANRRPAGVRLAALQLTRRAASRGRMRRCASGRLGPAGARATSPRSCSPMPAGTPGGDRLPLAHRAAHRRGRRITGVRLTTPRGHALAARGARLRDRGCVPAGDAPASGKNLSQVPRRFRPPPLSDA